MVNAIFYKALIFSPNTQITAGVEEFFYMNYRYMPAVSFDA